MSDLGRNMEKSIVSFRHCPSAAQASSSARRRRLSLRGLQQNLIRIHQPQLLLGRLLRILLRLHVNLILLELSGPLLLGLHLLLEIGLLCSILPV